MFFKTNGYRLFDEIIGMICLTVVKSRRQRYSRMYDLRKTLINAESGFFVARTILLNLREIPIAKLSYASRQALPSLIIFLEIMK